MWGTRGVGNKTGIHREQDGSDRSRHDNKQRQARERERRRRERKRERETDEYNQRNGAHIYARRYLGSVCACEIMDKGVLYMGD